MDDLQHLNFYILKFKFYLDQFWVYYSMVGIPFLLYYWLKNLFYPIDFRKAKKPNDLKTGRSDEKIIFFFIFFAPVYYSIDTLCLITSQIFLTEYCYVNLLIHHLISIPGLYFIVNANYYPFWQIGPGLLHAFLLVFPEYTFLNYIYLVTMIIFNIGIYTKPFTDWKQYKILKYIMVILYFALIYIQQSGCTNDLRDLSELYDRNHPDYLFNNKQIL